MQAMFTVNFIVVALLFTLRLCFACYVFPKGECAEKNLAAPETTYPPVPLFLRIICRRYFKLVSGGGVRFAVNLN